MKYQNISQVVAASLCTRCGTCLAACPQGAISLDSNYFPRINDTCQNCNLCVSTCPGWKVDYQKLAISPDKPQDDLAGYYKDLSLCAATNDQIKNNACGGGVVTGILTYLLDKGMINGAIVTTANSEKPWLPQTILATSREEIISASQSKYTIVPVNEALAKIKDKEGKFALVALPCQVQGFRKLAQTNKTLSDQIYLVIGLYCHLNMEIDATTTLIKNNHLKFTDIAKLEYRGGTWPGRIRVTLKNNRIIDLHQYDIKDGALNYLKRFYHAPRCLLCTDAAAELADFSIADAWIRDSQGDWLLRDKGRWSIVLERTERGQEVIQKAINDGALTKKTLPPDLIKSAHSAMITEKKKGATIRIAKLKKKKLPYPQYNTTLPPISVKNRLSENLYQLTLLPSHCPFCRNLLMKLCFSKLGNIFTGLKLKWKSYIRKSK